MGMISTTNYVARKYGVRAAMPGFIGKKLCPHLVFVKSHFEKYTVVAEQIRSVIREYDPDFTSHSLDEVYMDLTDAATVYVKNQRKKETEQESNDSAHPPPSSSSSTSFSSSSTTALPPPLPPHTYSSYSISGITDDLEAELEDDDCEINNTNTLTTPNTSSYTTITTTPTTTTLPIPLPLLRQAACIILEQIRHRIQVITGGLTCSAGIANNFFLAKICADVNKPDGQFELPGNRQGNFFVILLILRCLLQLLVIITLFLLLFLLLFIYSSH